jgi:hypothetical protein
MWRIEKSKDGLLWGRPRHMQQDFTRLIIALAIARHIVPPRGYIRVRDLETDVIPLQCSVRDLPAVLDARK